MPRLPHTVLIACLLFPALAQSHHSFFGRFDTQAAMELEGTVREIHWRNPHAHIFLEVAGPEGAGRSWVCSAPGPSPALTASCSRNPSTGITIWKIIP